MDRDWTVLLIGGASGTGKTSISHPLAATHGVNVVEVDDFQVLLGAMTTPDMLPPLHYWDTHPDWPQEGIPAAVQHLIDVGQVLLPGLEAVIRDHLETGIPMVMEGDFILPTLAAKFAGDPRVRALFISEPDAGQIEANYRLREPEAGVQHFRAQISHGYNTWLAEQCAALNIPMLPARPWADALQRAVQCIQAYKTES